jgi:tRNA(Ile)-lysidine synthase
MEKARKRVVARIESTVRRAVEEHALWPPGATVVAAVSGGPDSLALLGTLLALRERRDPQAPGEIVVAHLDHGLRGEAGAADAAFVAELAAERGLRCVVGREDVRALARREKRSLEDAARRARYRVLQSVAAEVGADCIALGHTRDDQAETVLMHFVRGSGLAGLAGMAPREGGLARPLLALTRAETVAYCEAQGWQPRYDASNEDPAFLRNRIRRELLPTLERYNPRLRETLARNAALIADDERYLEERARDAWDAALAEETAGTITFRLDVLRAQPDALRHRVLRAAVQRLAGAEQGLEAAHLAAAERLISRGVYGASIALPVGLRLSRGARSVAVERVRTPAVPEPALPEEMTLDVPGELALPALGLRLRAWRADELLPRLREGTLPEDQSSPAGSVAYLDADVSGDRLSVRAWRPGDRFQPLGLPHQKKLHDYFVDAKIPREQRARTPLVFGRDHLIWIAGQRLDHRARITPTTRHVLALALESDE